MGKAAPPAERPPLVGPIFFWELVRQSRKGTGLIILAVGVHSPFFLAMNLPMFLSQLAFFSLLGVFLSLTRMTPFQARFALASYFFLSYFVLPFFLRHWPHGTPTFFVALLCPYFTWYLPTGVDVAFIDVTAEIYLLTWGMTAVLLLLTEQRLKRLQERL